MLLHVEWTWVKEAANLSFARDSKGHEFAENVSNDCEKDNRYVYSLRFEVEDFLENGSESGQAET